MSETTQHLLILTPDAQVNTLMDRMLRSYGFSVTISQDPEAVQKLVKVSPPALLLVSEKINNSQGLAFAQKILEQSPALPVILLVYQDKPEILKQALQAGISDYLCLPLVADDVLRAIQNSLRKAAQRKQWVLLETRRATTSLQRRMGELEVLARLGRSIASSLDPDSVLSVVVDAAVELTQAEEGSLMLMDEQSGELYIRASRNFQEEFVRTFRLPINDTLAGSVIRSSQPVLLDDNAPQKIKTSYLVHSLVYVPLQLRGHTFGVLGVDNRQVSRPFTDHDVKLLTALAEYAVIAMENARMFETATRERNQLEAILNSTHDGVLVLDDDNRLLMANPIAHSALDLPDGSLKGMDAHELITQADLVDLLEGGGRISSNRVELTVSDGRIFSTELIPVEGVGSVITMHDITSLRKIDHIKNDFVSTVSHDLRSPLTAILGYAELIERAGPVTDMQREFIGRVQSSVHNITRLVDDLVNLGRIESGFDTRKEVIYLDQIIRYSVEGYKNALSTKNLQIQLSLADELPFISGNPVQIRQMVDHLLDNAIKYTHAGGSIHISLNVEEGQMILQIRDSGVGIPPVDLPYIFDKFYRASNAAPESSGTGLGLAIVRSIVEAHQGRVWVDSTLGQGSVFTIVLPISA